MKTTLYRCFVLIAFAALSVAAFAQLADRKVDIYSEGVRMTGYVIYPQALEGKKLPTIVMSHGWGHGLAAAPGCGALRERRLLCAGLRLPRLG